MLLKVDEARGMVATTNEDGRVLAEAELMPGGCFALLDDMPLETQEKDVTAPTS